MSVCEMIDGCKRNNHKDYKSLYERYYGYSLKIVFRYIYRYDKAVDVVNDGFVKVFGKLDSFNYNLSQNVEMMFMGWLRTIMINTSIDRLRRDNYLPEIGINNEEIWITDRSQSADNSLLYKELINQIKKLPPAYRAVFNLYVIDGYKHHEIAQKLNIAIGTSKSNLSKAKALLKTYINKNERQKQVCNT
jgi:RNA polymerase sigma factor (sigma-70 family)